MMLDRGELVGWFESREIMFEAGIAAVTMYLFVVHIFTWSNPFIDRRLFADRNFAIGCVLMFIVYGTMMSILSLMTPFLQTLSGYPVMKAGILMAPLGAGTMIAMLLVGRLLKYFSPRSIIFVGLSCLLYAVWMMREFTPDVSVASIIKASALEGVGVGLIMVPLTTLSYATLAPIQRTAAASVITLLRNIGGAIGISAMSFLISRNVQIVHEHLVQHITLANPLFRFEALGTYWNPTSQAGLIAINEEINRQATIISYNNDFQLLMMLVALIFPMLLILKSPKASKT
jgi:DHA2 family multidrug resistance protein